jgi:hypothetical protein
VCKKLYGYKENVIPHERIFKISPDGRTQNQTDHITIDRKWRASLMSEIKEQI